jgi:heme-degrading monooxygenase HmoA
MIFVRVWRYTVAEARREAFERAYGPEGDWARLFARQEGFRGTELLGAADSGSDGTLAYVTIDRWRDRADWGAFLAEHGEDYRALDVRLDKLTLQEEDHGDWLGAVGD